MPEEVRAEAGGLQDVWELVEHGNLAFEIASVLMPSVVAKLFGETTSFVELLVLTAPLTIAVALLVLIYAKVDMTGLQRIVAAAAILAGTALIAQLLGQPTRLHWAQDFGTVLRSPSVGGYLMLPLVFLVDYASIYGPGPFVLSVLMGGSWSGLRLYKEKKKERELAPLIQKNFQEASQVAPGIFFLREKVGAGEYPNERNFVLKKLEENNGDVSRTADVLGLKRSRLRDLVKILGITAKVR